MDSRHRLQGKPFMCVIKCPGAAQVSSAPPKCFASLKWQNNHGAITAAITALAHSKDFR